MWLSSEMVDSYFIRAIVCSGQKEPKKNKTVRETRSTKVKIGANIYSTQSQSAWFHISGQAYGTKVTNISWIKSRHQQNSKPEGNCMQKTTKLLTKFLHHADMEEKALLGLHIGIKMRCRLKIILRCTRGEIWKVKMKFEKWKWKFKSEKRRGRNYLREQSLQSLCSYNDPPQWNRIKIWFLRVADICNC